MITRLATSTAALLGLAALASGCIEDLGVGLSALDPDAASADDDESAPRDAGAGGDAGADAGMRADASTRADASSRGDARALDAAATDGRVPDASARDAAPEPADACAAGTGGPRCPRPDAGDPDMCWQFQCDSTLSAPAASLLPVCESGSMLCQRDDAGICGWVCVPPFFGTASEDDASAARDAGP